MIIVTTRINGYPHPEFQKKTSIPKNELPKVDRTFKSFLQEAWQEPVSTKTELKISKHAQKRLEERGIQLTETDLHTLEEAVSKMEEKGSQQSLLLYEDLALITSIHNRTIITALKTSDLTTVTDIDSAMLVEK